MQQHLPLLANKIILVTGSTTGIGEAIARGCISEGAQVMLHGRDEARAKQLCAELGPQAHYQLADLYKPESSQELIAATIKRFGAIHCLVNNAAVVTRSNIDTSDEEMFDFIISINLRAPLLLARAAIQEFRKQGNGGNIVNIGSLNAYCGQTDLLLYSMSKGGLMTMTRNLGDSLGKEKIRVNQLNVGWTTTVNEIELKKREGLPEGWQHNVPKVFAPTGQLLTPENVAEHVIFWLSDLSAPVSGSVCDVEQYPVIGRNKIVE